MKLTIKGQKGFTLVEVMFASITSVLMITILMAVWLYTYTSWTGETERVSQRAGMMKAIETIKGDMRLTSLTSASFYPAGSGPYSGISIPFAAVNASGLYNLNAQGKIDWQKTIVYHVYNESDGTMTLRRTVISPRDNTLSDAQIYAQLQSIVGSGGGVANSTTDTTFLENVETFEVSSLSSSFDFYEDSSSPVNAGKAVFGWVKLGSGEHTINFEVTGKNSSSVGYSFGFDRLMIEPSGSYREAEYYISSFAPEGMLVESGGSASRVFATGWSNNNFLEFGAGGVSSYIEFSDNYDLWRESAFDKAVLTNCKKDGEEARVLLDMPAAGLDGSYSWFVHEEAGDTVLEGHEGGLPLAAPVTVRTVVKSANIDRDGDFIRLRFRASDADDITIDKAYITLRSGSSGANGLANQSTAGHTVAEYHRHQQLFFYDSSGNITEGATISSAQDAWTAWTAFPLRMASDYLITVYISDTTATDYRYWEGADSNVRTYCVSGADTTCAGTPDWSGYTIGATSKDIFTVANIDVWANTGTVESQIFDTTLSSPSYDTVKWSEEKPADTSIVVKARSSSNEEMIGATDWASIAGTSSSPSGLSIGGGRYLQFYVTLLPGVIWSGGSSTQSYVQYITNQLALPVYQFPSDGSVFLTTSTVAPWIDDVEIQWSGTGDKICAIAGNIAKQNNYGQVKVTVDSKELLKVLSVHIKTSKVHYKRTIVEEDYVDMEPRNTGK